MCHSMPALAFNFEVFLFGQHALVTVLLVLTHYQTKGLNQTNLQI